MDNSELNQTQFIATSPWQDQQVLPPVEAPVPEEEPKKKLPILWIGIIGLLILVFIIMLAVILRPRMSKPSNSLDSTEMPLSGEMTALEREVASLSAELKKADPVKSEFPFPPVKMDLSLPSPSPKL